MKHNITVVLILLIFFLLTQLIGLAIVNAYFESPLPFGIERPEMDTETSFLPLFITILLVTVLALVLLKLRAIALWKLWFFLSVAFCLLVSFAILMPDKVALALASLLALWKVFKPNMMIHNFTELFIYGGLAAIFVPLFSLFSISILLVLISAYDIIAVWKTKHMVKLAKFQTKIKLFTGLLVPYSRMQKKHTVVRIAILGGGDMGFPLLFSGVVLRNFGFFNAIITSITASVALFLLFYFAKQKKFYPAMPFISLGCFIGFGLVHLI